VADHLYAAASRAYSVLEDLLSTIADPDGDALAARNELLAALQECHDGTAGMAQRQTQPS
jgi:hypothetical protein